MIHIEFKPDLFRLKRPLGDIFEIPQRCFFQDQLDLMLQHFKAAHLSDDLQYLYLSGNLEELADAQLLVRVAHQEGRTFSDTISFLRNNYGASAEVLDRDFKQLQFVDGTDPAVFLGRIRRFISAMTQLRGREFEADSLLFIYKVMDKLPVSTSNEVFWSSNAKEVRDIKFKDIERVLTTESCILRLHKMSHVSARPPPHLDSLAALPPFVLPSDEEFRTQTCQWCKLSTGKERPHFTHRCINLGRAAQARDEQAEALLARLTALRMFYSTRLHHRPNGR
jgi:hypothetical protein